jgi:hypothetical protein
MRSEFRGRSQRSKDDAGLRAAENVRAARMMAVPKHGETNTGATLGAALRELPTSRFFPNLRTIFWFRSSQCHRGVLSRALNTNREEKLTIQLVRKGGAIYQLQRRTQNAVCLDGVGHDGHSPNGASSDAANPDWRANPMTFVVKSEPCWTNEFEGAVTGAMRNARLEVLLQARQP